MTDAPPRGSLPGPLDFDTRSGRLQLTLGATRVDAGPVAPALDATLIAGLEEVLGAPAITGRQHRLALDRDGTRRLGVTRSPSGLELSLLDVHDRPVLPPLPLPLAGFAHAVQAFVGRGVAHPRMAEVHALVDWAEALDGRRGEVVSAPRARLSSAVETTPTPVPRLPVADLYHLAYRRAWRHDAPGLAELAADDHLVAVFDADGLRLLERHSGALRHRHDALRPLDGPEPMRWTVDADERLVALDRAGAVLWRAEPPDDPAPLQGAHPGEDCVLAITAGREAAGLDPLSGRTRWRYATHYGEIFGAAVRGRLGWLTAEDGLVHGLDLETGKRRFVVNPGDLDGQPHLTPAGLLVGLDGPSGSRLSCLDPLDGRTRWSAGLPGHLSRRPLHTVHGIVAIVEHGSDPVVAMLASDTGALRWMRPLDGPDLPVARVLDGLLCLKHIDGSAVALDPADGQMCWLLVGDDPELTLRSNPAPLASRGLLLIPGTTIRAVDPTDGRVVHRIDCDELVPDRLHVWPDGDLVIAEHDAVARYLLGGHIALVR